MSAGGERILVVDDNEMNRDVLSRRLTRKGYDVFEAHEGAEALRLIAQHTFDLVLLDIEMPGVSGLDVLKEVRTSHSPTRLPIIMVTARSQSEDIVSALRLKANDYVTKPVDFEVALARIQNQLSHKRAEDALRDSEERYALAARGSNDGLWDWDLRSDKVYYSPRWKAMLGCDESDIGNAPNEWFGRVHADDVDRLKQDIAAHLSGLTPHFENEHRMKTQAGMYRWMLTRGVAVHTGCQATRFAGSLTDITEGKVADSLTGLPNRVLFLDRLEQALKRANRKQGSLFAVFFLDLDRFKVINDSLGHVIGDQLLINIARRLDSCIRSTDTVARAPSELTVARLGGDEFTILLEDIQNVTNAIAVADRIQEALRLPFDLGGHEVFTSASIGIKLNTTSQESAEEILRDADTAMYRAKALGKARYEIFDAAMREKAVERLQLETDLRRAIERKEFRNFYQPIVELATGRIVGFEALVRWQPPHHEMVLPSDFIPIAEETGMILEIGRYVLFEACRQLKVWLEQYPNSPDLVVSVNLSAKQFLQKDLVEQIQQALKENGLSPKQLKLEITESVIMEDPRAATEMLGRFREMNIELGIDDFGTGYSSLSYLHRFPLNTLKVDRSFVSALGNDGENTEIVRAIVTLAHNLGLDVIAEGIEFRQHLLQLEELGCEYGQGYYFSRPVDGEAAGKLLVTETSKEHVPLNT